MSGTEKINKIKNKIESGMALPDSYRSRLICLLEPILKEGKNFLNCDFLFLLHFQAEPKEQGQEPSGVVGNKKMEVWLALGQDESLKQTLAERIETEGESSFFPSGLLIQETTIIPDVSLESKIKTGLPCKSLIFVPLFKDQEFFGGILGNWYYQKHNFSNWEIRGSEILGSYVSMSIQNFQLQTQLEIQVERVQALLELATTIYSTLDYKVVLEKVIHYAKKLADADGCTIYLLDRETQTLKPWLSNYDVTRHNWRARV